jgi:hypothetical protein
MKLNHVISNDPFVALLLILPLVGDCCEDGNIKLDKLVVRRQACICMLEVTFGTLFSCAYSINVLF